MGNTERAVDPVAVLKRNSIPSISRVFDIMASDAEVVGSKAVVSGLRAAVHAFPVDL